MPLTRHILSPRKTDYRVSVLRTHAEFQALAEEWDRLLSDSGECNINLEHRFLMEWLNGFPPLTLLVVLIRNSAGKLLAAAPFKIDRISSGLFRRTLRRLQFIGSNPDVYEWMKIIHCPAENGTLVLEAVARQLMEEKQLWDVIDLRYGQDNEQLDLLGNLLIAGGAFEKRLSQGTTNPYLPLPQTMPEFETLRMKKNMKSNLKYSLNRLKAAYPDSELRLDILSPAAPDTTAAMEAFFQAHIAYWRDRGVRSNFLLFPKLGAFYKNLHRLYDDPDRGKGRVEFSQLKMGEATLSSVLAFWSGDRLMAHLLNHNSSYRRYTPGALHYRFLIEHCIQQGGTCLDFGRGEEEYKARWTELQMPLWDLQLFRSRRVFLQWQLDELLKRVYTRSALLLFRKRALHPLP